MSFIAGIAFERKTFSETHFHRIGKLWYDGENHSCSLLLNGFRFGHLVAKPFDQNNAPYIKGDINLVTDEYESDGSMKKNYLWCGFVHTDTDQRGPIYQIVLEVNPLAMLLSKQVNIKEDNVPIKPGLFLTVHLEDREERKKWTKPEPPVQVNMPEAAMEEFERTLLEDELPF